MNEKDLERKKRGRLSSLILSFEDIMDVEDKITTEILTYNKLLTDEDEIIKSITLKDIEYVINELKIENKSILKISSN